jgi:uncharacterized protein (DUF2141 family)
LVVEQHFIHSDVGLIMVLQLFLSILFHSMTIEKPTELNVSGSIHIEVSGIRNDNGFLLIALFNQEKGFPDKEVLAFRKERIPAKKGTMKFDFSNLPPGKYAFGIIHDENDNRILDKGLFGIPKEGFCFSRQAMGTVGPPSFQSASIDVNTSAAVQILKISYW